MRMAKLTVVLLLSIASLMLQPCLGLAEEAKIPTLIVTGHDVVPAHPCAIRRH